MGNLISLMVHCGRGEGYLVGDLQHTYIAEAGGSAVAGGIHPQVLPSQEDGTLSLTAIERSIHPEDPHYTRIRLISLENSHNRQGGRVLPLEYIQQVRTIADRSGLKMHCDGARMWHAAVGFE